MRPRGSSVELEQVGEAGGELLAADGGEHDGGGAGGDSAVDGVGEDAAAGGVEADVGGVEEQEARGGEERAGEERAARLAVGEGDEVAVEECAEAHLADDAVAPSREGGDGAGRALDPLPRVDVLDGVLREPRAERGRGLLLGGDPAHLDVGVHLGEELRLALERDDGDRALGVAPARAGEAVSDLGLGREERAGEEAGEDGLAAAVRADDAPVLAAAPDEAGVFLLGGDGLAGLQIRQFRQGSLADQFDVDRFVVEVFDNDRIVVIEEGYGLGSATHT